MFTVCIVDHNKVISLLGAMQAGYACHKQFAHYLHYLLLAHMLTFAVLHKGLKQVPVLRGT